MNLTKGRRETAPIGPEGHAMRERNEKRRTYDRLRKASLRRIDYMNVDGRYWTHMSHEAYVRGLRDGLNA